MSEPHPPGDPAEASIAHEIEELAGRLHEADHLQPEARAEVARLLGELRTVLAHAERSPHAEDLAQGTAELVRAVKEERDPGLVSAARTRLDDAVSRAEAESPLATNIVIRLLDVLTGIGL